MKIAILTYNVPHRKTFDLVCRLLASGHKDITLFALPFEDRSFKPLFEHRPPVVINISPDRMRHNFGIKLTVCEIVYLEDHFKEGRYDKILIGGCGLLPEELIQFRIINSHPGYLPDVRGLDALKWAILKGLPIGVTTHIISSDPDAGEILARKIIPVLSTDTFHSIAYRQYELEVAMLIEAITIDSTNNFYQDYNFPTYPVHKRMSKDDELAMMIKLKQQI